jgi:hypothetical protein
MYIRCVGKALLQGGKDPDIYHGIAERQGNPQCMELAGREFTEHHT